MSKLTRLPVISKFHSYAADAAHAIPGRKPKWMSAQEAVTLINSGDCVAVHQATATPVALLNALCDYGKASNLRDVKLVQLLTFGASRCNSPEMNGILRPNCMFVSTDSRQAVNDGRGDVMPVFLSEVPLLFHKEIVKPRVSLVQVTPADEHGFHSLGPTVDFIRAAIAKSEIVIGQVNKKLPRTFGDALVHESHFDALVEVDHDLPEVKPTPLSDEEKQIGKYIAENLVEDGSTLQTGIGSIPDAVLQQLTNHKDLGVHSEMISDGCVDLFNTGAITNRLKTIERGLIVATFTIGTKKLFNFMNNNPSLIMRVSDFTNNQFVIAQNPKVVAINSCLEIDLVGNVCSDTIGPKVYSGFGGQVDFLRGAASSLDGKGKAILTFLSTTSKGESKIVPFLKPGASVTTTRAHVHYVVTEYGIAQLFGKNYRQRAYALINIAHPNHREALEKAAFERLKCLPSKD
ncbi:4-hydroxybutyrate coenzyme A transferase-like protein [Leptotrombidium deliense]|uniref:4-hydroxybutyrate coenzyme A transferase-like protein n=1 Tax=Leptotrombidium deliense TaxID=299467 RepID=A0A443SCN6_9ACAR|nr:4-hydroxybutyrate coenzyme A transferase-like protein [Leptotrombidium deliense]